VASVAAGLQFGWALQLSLLTPYVQQLGIPHAWASYIWLCGPLSGLLVQPLIGHWSDSCRCPYGRRRPFIVAGSALVAVAAMLIAFSRDLGYALGDEKVEPGRPLVGAIVVFILGFWLLDLANNSLQGPCRALLADFTGTEGKRTRRANAYFSAFMALGNVLGFAAGSYPHLASALSSPLSLLLHPFGGFSLVTAACNGVCANLKAAFMLHVVLLLVSTVVSVSAASEVPLSDADGSGAFAGGAVGAAGGAGGVGAAGAAAGAGGAGGAAGGDSTAAVVSGADAVAMAAIRGAFSEDSLMRQPLLPCRPNHAPAAAAPTASPASAAVHVLVTVHAPAAVHVPVTVHAPATVHVPVTVHAPATVHVPIARSSSSSSSRSSISGSGTSGVFSTGGVWPVDDSLEGLFAADSLQADPAHAEMGEGKTRESNEGMSRSESGFGASEIEEMGAGEMGHKRRANGSRTVEAEKGGTRQAEQQKEDESEVGEGEGEGEEEEEEEEGEEEEGEEEPKQVLLWELVSSVFGGSSNPRESALAAATAAAKAAVANAAAAAAAARTDAGAAAGSSLAAGNAASGVASASSEAALKAYSRGVRFGALGLVLNSVVQGVTSLRIDALCRRFGSRTVWAVGNLVLAVCLLATAAVPSAAPVVPQIRLATAAVPAGAPAQNELVTNVAVPSAAPAAAHLSQPNATRSLCCSLPQNQLPTAGFRKLGVLESKPAVLRQHSLLLPISGLSRLTSVSGMTQSRVAKAAALTIFAVLGAPMAVSHSSHAMAVSGAMYSSVVVSGYDATSVLSCTHSNIAGANIPGFMAAAAFAAAATTVFQPPRPTLSVPPVLLSLTLGVTPSDVCVIGHQSLGCILLRPLACPTLLLSFCPPVLPSCHSLPPAQMFVSLVIGPFDAFFGGGNIPGFMAAAAFAAAAAAAAFFTLPRPPPDTPPPPRPSASRASLSTTSSPHWIHAARIKPAQEKFLLSLMPYLNEYIYNETWRAGTDCSKWEGVKCNPQGAVVRIELNLWETGPIPPTITTLNSLQHLEISGMNLTGSLPESIGALLTLTNIRISSTTGGCSGRIPRSFPSLTNLVSLDLFGHRFSGGVPPALSSLKRLTYLSLALNQLSGPIPAALGSLQNLKTLLLAHNRLTGAVPRQLSGLRLLEELNLQENRLVGPLPGRLTALAPALKILDLSYNPIGGAFPYKLINRLSRLEGLNMQQAGIKDSTLSLGQLWRHPSLRSIDLSSNNFSGNLPPILGRIKNLNKLYLRKNRLNGSVSWKFFAYKPPLTDLSLSYNQLTGEFPWAAIKAGVAGTLWHLDIASNSFVGSIPSAALATVRLTDFNISENYFSGKLPQLGKECPSCLVPSSPLIFSVAVAICVAAGGGVWADVEGWADVLVSREEEVGGDRCDHVADAEWPAISGAEFHKYGQAEVLGVE
ncbi:unnamed protein product, partial [Closterium sp. NIES-53]